MAEKKAKKSAGGEDARQANLDSALAQITKTFGEGSIMRLGDANAQSSIEGISTGSLSLDLALGIGGVPKGRIIEIYGPESSGKTTVMLHVIANAQKAGRRVSFIDAEHALDPQYARKLGVNLDDLLVSQPDSGEEALTICETLARSNSVGRDRGGLRGGARAQGRAGGRHGHGHDGHAGAVDEPGTAEVGGDFEQGEDDLYFHEPIA